MTDRFSVSVLVAICYALVLFPLTTRKYPRCNVLFRTANWILVAFIVLGGPASIFVKDTLFSKTPISSRVVYDLSFGFLCLSNILISFKVGAHQEEFLKLLEEFLESLTLNKCFGRYFVAFLLISTLDTICIILTQMRRTSNVYYYLSVFMVEGFLTCRVGTALFVIILIVRNMKNKFEALNKSLSKCGNIKEVHMESRRHNKLCDEVEYINGLFGNVLIISIFFLITGILRHATFISLNYNNTLITSVRSLWIFSYGLQASYLAHVGQELSLETNKTVSICYKLIEKVSIDNEIFYKQLFLLSQQAKNRRVMISAAGFFNIDHSMILFIASTFCTYFIVVMQLLST